MQPDYTPNTEQLDRGRAGLHEADALRRLYNTQRSDYFTKRIQERPKTDYLDKVHQLPFIPPLAAVKMQQLGLDKKIGTDDVTSLSHQDNSYLPGLAITKTYSASSYSPQRPNNLSQTQNYLI